MRAFLHNLWYNESVHGKTASIRRREKNGHVDKNADRGAVSGSVGPVSASERGHARLRRLGLHRGARQDPGSVLRRWNAAESAEPEMPADGVRHVRYAGAGPGGQRIPGRRGRDRRTDGGYPLAGRYLRYRDARLRPERGRGPGAAGGVPGAASAQSRSRSIWRA